MLQPAPLQTTYTQYLTIAQAGMPATTTGWDVDTKITEDPSGNGIAFGLAVSQGTLHGDRSACLGALSGSHFIGITAANQTLSTLPAGVADTYHDTDNMAVAVRGDWWVKVHGAVKAGDQVTFDPTTGQLGFSGGTVVEDARFMTSAAAGAFAVVRLASSAGNSGG